MTYEPERAHAMPQAAKKFPEDTNARSNRPRSGEHGRPALFCLPVGLDWLAVGLTFGAVASAVGIGSVLWPWIGVGNIGLIFLTAIVAVAARFGLWPSLLATVLSSLCYNFFFTAPYYTLAIDEPANVVAIAVFTLVAVIVSNVAARARIQAIAAVERARTTELLYAFSRKLTGTGTLDDVLWATAHQIALMLNVRVVILLPENGSVAVKAGYPPEDRLDEADFAAAQWSWQRDVPAGLGSGVRADAKRLFLPMRTGRGVVGVLGIDSDLADPPGAAERRLLDALVDQSALAIERVHLVEDMERVKLTFETERLRSALLTSISHDLKTPLAAVLGAAGTLRDLGSKLDQDQKVELLATIIDESERLNRFIANLLDMTRLESGAIVPNIARHDLHEIVGSVLRRAGKILQPQRVELDLAGELPMIELDAVLFEQVLFNLLDNASKYAPAGTAIIVRSRLEPDNMVALQVMDEGDGIPHSDLGLIFEKFYRVRKGDRVRAGTGLGLSISRGFVEAMRGTIAVANRSDRRGAVFTIRLPIPPASPRLDEVA